MKYSVLVLFMITIVLPKSDAARTGVQQQVNKILSEQLDVPEAEITPGSNLKYDLHADDLDMVELVVTLEQKFEIDIPDEDAERFSTVNDIVQYVENH